MNQSVLFSIIIPSFNKGDFIKETLSSLEQQSLKSFETIVVDDASSDSSVVTISNFNTKLPSLQLIENETTKGACFCRNKGARLARGKYLIFLDADDLLEKDCLQKRSNEIEQHMSKDIWVFALSSFSERKDNKISDWIPTDENLLERFLSHKLPWVIHQAVWDKAFFERIGGFDETFPRLQDVELHTRALLNGARVFVSGRTPDCYYRVEESRISGDYDKFYQQWVNGTICFYKKFYSQLDVRMRKKIRITVLYMIDALWYASAKKKISTEFSRKLASLTIEETVGLSGIAKASRLLGMYYRIKMRFSFNIPGLRRIAGFFLTH